MKIKDITFTKDYKMYKKNMNFIFSSDRINIVAGKGCSGKSTLTRLVHAVSSSKVNSFNEFVEVKYFKFDPNMDPVIIDNTFNVLSDDEASVLYKILQKYVEKLNMQVIITLRNSSVDNHKIANANWINLP